ncbi:DUF350 domain-containing protein [Thalassospira sp.]|jgi:putative membrane protein|uniref:DUF350 domain-containing protein n=1 Tax=Thalassospira sp. TaxID=1912094 RepID=UPI001B07CAF9|nr:DUF350 domain-containing protein [Thalassospira sp.]MBO6773797.1 DUF350 domain-containing protein [Thalassospira sp.]|tara:strand:+ start:5733 stop:6179 length:447 start_codon:yes stop_codon:yes gene_type:complete
MILDTILPMLTGIAAVMGFMALYVKLTKHDEQKLINANNPAASIAYVGVMLGYALPVMGLVLNTLPNDEFLMWSLLAAAFQLFVYIVYDRVLPLLFKRIQSMSTRIEDGQIAPALQMAGFAVVVGMLNFAVTINLQPGNIVAVVETLK